MRTESNYAARRFAERLVLEADARIITARGTAATFRYPLPGGGRNIRMVRSRLSGKWEYPRDSMYEQFLRPVMSLLPPGLRCEPVEYDPSSFTDYYARDRYVNITLEVTPTAEYAAQRYQALQSPAFEEMMHRNAQGILETLARGMSTHQDLVVSDAGLDIDDGDCSYQVASYREAGMRDLVSVQERFSMARMLAEILNGRNHTPGTEYRVRAFVNPNEYNWTADTESRIEVVINICNIW